jgi:hypothetical protein
MEKVTPKGLTREELRRLSVGAKCDCMCSLDQLAGAKGAGSNSTTCGCFCSAQFSAGNKNTANDKKSVNIFSTLAEIKEQLNMT